jgi:hypothetical protein
MKIVAFLQNQWFHEPEKVRSIYARNPGRREALNKRFLFAKSFTGRRLRAAFGELCDEIVWEETSPEIGDKSSAEFPPDAEHIQRVLDKHQPDLVLLFGRNALKGVSPLWTGATVCFPHPAARTLKPSEIRKWHLQLEPYLR